MKFDLDDNTLQNLLEGSYLFRSLVIRKLNEQEKELATLRAGKTPLPWLVEQTRVYIVKHLRENKIAAIKHLRSVAQESPSPFEEAGLKSGGMGMGLAEAKNTVEKWLAEPL